MRMRMMIMMEKLAEFRRPHVNGDEAESRVVDGLPVFPLHLAQNTGWSVHQHNHLFLLIIICLFLAHAHANVKSEGAPLPPPDSLFGPPPPLETTGPGGGSPGPQGDPTGNLLVAGPVSSSSSLSYNINHSHYYSPTDLYSGYPVASVFSAVGGAQKAALQPTRQRTKARSNAGNNEDSTAVAPLLTLLVVVVL